MANSEQSIDRIILAAVFLSAILLFSFQWTSGLAGDVSIVGAERVLAGDIPYRDFWTMYSPGHFYLLALLFYFFGSHIVVSVVAGTVVTSAAAASLYLLARKCGGALFSALTCVAIFVAAMLNAGYYRYFGSYPITIFLVFVGLYFLVSYLHDTESWFLFAAGCFVGIAIVTKHDVGIYTAVFSTAGLTAFHFLRNRGSSGYDNLPPFFSSLAVYFAGIALLSVPAYLYFALVAGSDTVRDLIIFPLTDFPLSRPENYPGIIPRSIRGGSNFKTFVNFANYLCFNLPLFLAILGGISTVVAYRKRRPIEFALTVMFSLAFVFHNRAGHVQINTHIISLSAYGALLGLVTFGLFRDRYGHVGEKKLWPIGTVFVGVWLTALLAAPVYEAHSVWNRPISVLDLPKVSGMRVESVEADNYKRLVSLVNEHVLPGEPIHIGLNRHDALLIGDTKLYFILDRPSATRYHELHPAITDTRPVQLEMIEDIRQNNVRLIVRKAIFNDAKINEIKANFLDTLPNIGATDLDHLINENFHEIERFDKYSVLLKN